RRAPSPPLFPYTPLFRSLRDSAVVDQRAYLDAGVDAVADDHGGDALREPLEHVVVDAALHVDAVRADARLAGVPELRRDHPLDRDRKSTRLNSSHVAISY